MKGIRPEWAHLPKRKCDNCGIPYRPLRPVRKGECGFHHPNCRKEYHKRGGSFSKLKPVILKEVRRAVRERDPLDTQWQERIEKRIADLERTMKGVREVFLLDYSETK